MIPNVSWMVAADSLILFYLSDHRIRIAQSPANVAINVGMNNTHANRRMKIMADAGLLEVVDDRGYYRITELGERFILGDLDKEEVEKLDPEED